MEGRDSRGASGDVAKEFETRIGKCGLLPLSSAGVEVSNKLHPTCTVVKVKSADRVALLLDISNYILLKKYSILEADISTSVHDNMASDIFLVQQEDGKKIDKPRTFAEDVRDVILKSNAHVESESFNDGGVDGGSAVDTGAVPSPGSNLVHATAPEAVMKEGTDGGGDEVFKVNMVANGDDGGGSGDGSGSGNGGGDGDGDSGGDGDDKGVSRASTGSTAVIRGDGLRLTNNATDATEITMEVPDRPGLLADVMLCLQRNNVNVVQAYIYTTPDGIASNYLSVTDNVTKGKVPDAVLEKVRQALAARCHRKAVAAVSRRHLRTPGVGDAVSSMTGAVDAAQQQLTHLDLHLRPPVRVLSKEDRSAVEAALSVLPAYASLAFQSARDEILGELREVRWEAGQTAFEQGTFISNLYIIMEGALHRASFTTDSGNDQPAAVLSPGCLLGEVAMAHAYATPGKVTSMDTDVSIEGGGAAYVGATGRGMGTGTGTMAYAISIETFKRIVRTRIHRARQLCTNVLNIIETFRLVPAESKELLLNALWSSSVAFEPGAQIAGKGLVEQSEPALHIIIEGEVRQSSPDGSGPGTGVSRQAVPVNLRAADSFGEDWLLSPEARTRASACCPLPDRELSRSYYAVQHTVTLAVTRTLLASLWGDSFDTFLRSRHDAHEHGVGARIKVTDSGTILGGCGHMQTTGAPKRSGTSMDEWPRTPMAKSGSFDSQRELPETLHKQNSQNSRSHAPTRNCYGLNWQPSVSDQRGAKGTAANSRLSVGTTAALEAAAAAGTSSEPTLKKSSSKSFLSNFKSFSTKMKRILGTGGSASKSRESTPNSSLGDSISTAQGEDMGDAAIRPSPTKSTSHALGPGKGTMGMRHAHSVADISLMYGATTKPAVKSGGGFVSSYSPTAGAMGMSANEFEMAHTHGVVGGDGHAVPAPGPLDGYIFSKQLGVGLTGSVYKAWRRNSPSASDGGGSAGASAGSADAGSPPDGAAAGGAGDDAASCCAVAVKIMDKVKILNINETSHVVQESRIMRSVSKHPFIITMLDSFQTNTALFIVMEYASGRDLFFMIHEQGALSMFQTRAFLVQVVLALDHVHSKGFVYRDLKPENLLVREDGYLRLTDFGFAKALQPGERAYTVCGTPDYLAPETLRQQGCNRAADFWAIGILLFEMMTGYPPFHGQTHSDLYRRITAGRMRTFPRAMPEEAQDLVKRLLKQGEGERIGVGSEGIQKIRRHPFFKGFSWTAILEQRVEMVRPKVKPDVDQGPEDIKDPVQVPCLLEPSYLTPKEQDLFATF